MIFKLKYFSHVMKIMEGFVEEGYEVTSKQVMKPWPNNYTVDYYSVEVKKEDDCKEDSF